MSRNRKPAPKSDLPATTTAAPSAVSDRNGEVWGRDSRTGLYRDPQYGGAFSLLSLASELGPLQRVDRPQVAPCLPTFKRREVAA